MQRNTDHEHCKRLGDVPSTWRLARAGDASAREQLIQAALSGARAAARRLGLRAQEQEDICQMVAVSLIDRLDHANCPVNFHGMVWGLTRSAAGTQWRKWRRMTSPIDEAMDPVEAREHDHPLSGLVQEEFDRILSELLEDMKDEHSLPFELRYLRNYSVSEVAEALEVTQRTIYQRLKLACDALAHRLTKLGVEP